MGGRSPTLQFLGGAGTVTGSKHLIRAGAASVLVDCGLFQGPRELRQRNWDPLPFGPEQLDAVVLTHAHVDHSGYVPRLVASGYRGPIYATPATIELAHIVLPDCGHLQEEEAEYVNRKGYSRHHPALPLYTEDDAREALRLFQPVPFGIATDLGDGITMTFSRAGHILGSASVRVAIGEDGPSVGFSGDLGRPNHPILVAPDPPPDVDQLVVESTYGDRFHDDADALDELADVIGSTVARGGSVLIPAFAVDRTEIILYNLATLAAEQRLPPVPVFVDSPMALSALTVYRDAIRRGDPDVRPRAATLPHVFDVPGLQEVRDVELSKALNNPAMPSVIISASGMASGGRVVHHLAHQLPDERNTVLLVGFQAAGTRGRQLLEGARELRLVGRHVRVRAQVRDLPAYSVHADAGELDDWVAAAPRVPDDVYVVHGEKHASEALAARLAERLDVCAVVPYPNERVRLDRLRVAS